MSIRKWRAFPNVDVADIDALKGLVEVTLEHRRAAIPLVEEIIAEHIERFAQWYQSRVAIPVVASLVQKAEADALSRNRAALRALPGAHRTRAHADHRRLADDHLETAA